ncbi:MAG TPA: hypothetical protein VFL83_20695 [Anaeromyxobacter sp.]|nr:hypothetical protein [Anaeromyxobacter sp.]
MSSIAQTFTSTSPRARAAARTTSSVTFVATPLALFGQPIQSAPAGSRRFRAPASAVSSSRAERTKKTPRSNGSRGVTRDSAERGPSEAANPPGAAEMRSRWPDLSPSFAESGVPE